jgi:hypothetical protein
MHATIKVLLESFSSWSMQGGYKAAIEARTDTWKEANFREELSLEAEE